VAVIDVDYHAGNGTASIFYADPRVLVCSIHADPELEYPYNAGFARQTGSGSGVGATHHAPLAALAGWPEYRTALEGCLAKVKSFGAKALVVSLGLDTVQGDPECLPLGGMRLNPPGDYVAMGELLRSSGLPICYVAEGGYMLESVPLAARCVVLGSGA
jgi:acetoin utilization deacetylase AcuC-like enzyme